MTVLGFCVRQENDEVKESFSVSHFQTQILFKLLLVQGHHILSFDLVPIEDLFVLPQARTLQKINNFLNCPLLDIFIDKLQFCNFAQSIVFKQNAELKFLYFRVFTLKIVKILSVESLLVQS